MAVSEAVAAPQILSPADIALAYHARTRHTPERYASGPETLDWDAQPNPFREFEGCARTLLPLSGDKPDTRYPQLFITDAVAPAALTLEAVGALLHLSMGLSAWKEYGPDRWAVRCNPSSGNLHPTETYVFSNSIPGLSDGLHHYLSREHALEQRYTGKVDPSSEAQLWIGLSSVHWREAWKYGERAFRYCQLDVGHALGAFRYAAAALGWRAQMVEGLGSAELAALMGVDRAADFGRAEPEDADLLLAIDCAPQAAQRSASSPIIPTGLGDWTGHANLLDPHPMYRWPVIAQVSAATQGFAVPTPPESVGQTLPSSEAPQVHASDVILQRRSAQRFDSKFVMPAGQFHRLLDSLQVRPVAPWDVWTFAPRLHPILFVHRVEGLAPGIYAMPRDRAILPALKTTLRSDFEWTTPDGTPAHLPLSRLVAADCRKISKAMNCHQAIASDGCFSVSMIAEFEPLVRANSWRYRQLHWEAGLLGHALYLEAEAAGLRGTGIGCYFDDALHGLLGIGSREFQALYHFTVGNPITDARILTLPAYPDRPTNEETKA